METDVNVSVRYNEGTGAWYIYILGKKIGRGFRQKEIAEAISRWFASGLQDISDVFSDIVDKAFKENT